MMQSQSRAKQVALPQYDNILSQTAMPKICAFGDVHLGTYSYPTREFILNAMREIADKIAALEPDLIFFAGDAFRHRHPPVHDIAAFGHFLAELAQIAEVFVIPGNHDKTARSSTVEVYGEIDNVHVAETPQVYQHPLCDITLMPWLPAKALTTFGEDLNVERQDNIAVIKALLDYLKDAQRPYHYQVLLSHCTVLGSKMGDEVSTVLGDDILWTNDMFSGFDLAILGHLHKPQSFMEISPCRHGMHYTGSLCPTSFNEDGQIKGLLYADGVVVMRKTIESTPVFVRARADELDLLEGFNRDVFLRIQKRPGEPDPENIPDCFWYEITVDREVKEQRLRIEGDAADITTKQAITRWLELNDYGDDTWAVLQFIEELERERP